MCSISHDKKAIFIHINKTAGSYIAGTLEKYYGFQTFYLKRPDHESFCFSIKKNPKQKYYVHVIMVINNGQLQDVVFIVVGLYLILVIIY